jgi:hypothetical protein
VPHPRSDVNRRSDPASMSLTIQADRPASVQGVSA